MGNKKFIIFKIATILALLIAVGVLMFLFYVIFNNKISITSNNHIIYLAALFFLLLAGIAFQLQNILLASCAETEDLPWPKLVKYHTILLVCNAFGTIGVGVVLYSIVLEVCAKGLDQPAPSIIILWFCTIWFFANLISIIGSLNIRNYLHIRQIRKERSLLDNFGK